MQKNKEYHNSFFVHPKELFRFVFHSGGGRLYKPWPASPKVVLLAGGYHFMLLKIVSLTYLNDFGCRS